MKTNRPYATFRSTGSPYPAAIALVIDIANGVDHGLGLVELDILRAVAGEDLSGVRRKFEPARLSQGRLLFVFEVLRRVRGLFVEVADTVIAGSKHANRPGAK